MIRCDEFLELLKKEEIDFFTGVPCSIFKDLLNFLNDNKSKYRHVIAASEGEAVGIASGHYLSSGRIPVVYMQNSGLGNSVNPLTSLTNKEVFGIPVLIFVSWRGEPGIKDEPEHIRMGKITKGILETLGIEYLELPNDIKEISESIGSAKNIMLKKKEPFAFIVRRGIFEGYESRSGKECVGVLLIREEAISIVADEVYGKGYIVSTTGKISRELFEHMDKTGKGHDSVFYTVGSMGCSIGISLGLALNTDKKIFLFDGDGAALMKLGSLATVGHYRMENLYHIIFDNQCYDSTGGQPTVSETVDFAQIAKSCGYNKVAVIKEVKDLKDSARDLPDKKGPYMMVVKVKPGSRRDLGRPTISPQANREKFMDLFKGIR